MVDIPRFTVKAPRRGNLEPSTDDGAPEALATLARSSAAISADLGRMADRARRREGIEAGTAAAGSVEMPSVDFAFDQQSPATTPERPKPVADGAGSGAATALSYVNSGAIRSQPLQPLLEGRLSEAVSAVYGDGYRVQVYSGGQPGKGAGRRTGSVRHDHGKAADVYVVGPDGKRINGDALAPLGQYWAAKRFGGVGLEMRGGGIHLDMWETPPAGGGMHWNYARQGGNYTPAMRAAMARGLAGELPSLAGGVAPSPGNAVAESGSPATGTAPTGIRVAVTGKVGAVPQAQPGTIYGDAFNEAALDLHLTRVDTAMRAQMQGLALQYENDPAGLAEAIAATKAGFTEGLPARQSALVGAEFDRQAFSLLRDAGNTYQKRAEQERLAALEENIDARLNSALRTAARAGLDAQADAVLAGELGGIDAAIDGSPLDPVRKRRLRADIHDDVLAARAVGAFENIRDPAARAAYADTLQKEWREGSGFGGRLSAKAFEKANAEILRGVQRDEAQTARRASALDKAVDGQITMMKKGWPVPEATRRQLRGEVAATGDADLAANLDFLDHLADWQKAHIGARPEVLDAQIAALRERITKEGASQAALTTLDVMDGLRDEMDRQLKENPLGWAQRAGVLTVEPLSFERSDMLAASLTERVADAEAVAQHYGRPARYFTPAEADGLKKMIDADPLQLPSLVSGLSAGLGDATPAALAEISKDAPVLAHVAGLVHATGRDRTAIEIAEQLAARKDKSYKANLPTPAKLQAAAIETIGPALAALPATAAAAIDTAAVLAERRLAQRGLAGDDFAAGTPARATFEQALDEVLGATVRDGTKYGGLTQVNGWSTIAPPDVAADAVQDMIDALSPDDLLFQGAIGTANRVPITMQQLRRGRLVMSGPGRYRIALGDVEAGDPRYVPDAGGRDFFELDIGMLARTQRDRGAQGSGWTGRRVR